MGGIVSALRARGRARWRTPSELYYERFAQADLGVGVDVEDGGGATLRGRGRGWSVLSRLSGRYVGNYAFGSGIVGIGKAMNKQRSEVGIIEIPTFNRGRVRLHVGRRAPRQ